MNFTDAMRTISGSESTIDETGMRTIPFDESTPEGRLRAALSGSGRPTLMIPIAHAADSTAIASGKGLTISFETLVEGSSHVRFMMLRSEQEELDRVFNRIADAILDRIEAGGTVTQVVSNVLDEFRKLLNRKMGRLSDEEFAGLIGELEFMLKAAKLGPMALETWTGPDKARHDFTGSVVDVEVKASWSVKPQAVRIHGLQQLLAAESKRLILAVFGMERTGTGGKTLCDLITELTQAGIASDALTSKLEDAGVNDPSEYDAKRFLPAGFRIFDIRDDFPKLTESSFVGASLPSGIRQVDFTVDLGVASSFMMDEEAADELVRQMVTPDA
jgi:hypothetical protein